MALPEQHPDLSVRQIINTKKKTKQDKNLLKN